MFTFTKNLRNLNRKYFFNNKKFITFDQKKINYIDCINAIAIIKKNFSEKISNKEEYKVKENENNENNNVINNNYNLTIKEEEKSHIEIAEKKANRKKN